MAWFLQHGSLKGCSEAEIAEQRLVKPSSGDRHELVGGSPVKTAFLCDQCGSRLVAKLSLAGRKSRCPKCGHGVVVPSSAGAAGYWRAAVSQQLEPQKVLQGGAPRHPADDTGGFRLKSVTPIDVPPLEAAAKKPTLATPRSGAEKRAPQEAVPQKASKQRGVGPRPKSAVATQPSKGHLSSAAGAATAGGDDDELKSLFGDEDEVAFEFNPPERVVAPSQVKNPLADVFRVYRSLFSVLARLTSGISEASYTISFILLILAVAGGMIGNHGLVSLGLGLIVLLNVIGVIGDFASLVMLSFRKDPMQGLLFLLPPYAVYYIWADWKRYQHIVGRMRIPVLMIGVVLVAYAFVPWLSGERQPDADDATTVDAATADSVAGEGGEPPPAELQGDADPGADVGYGVGGVERAAAWVWSFFGGEPTALFHISEGASSQDEDADQPEEAE